MPLITPSEICVLKLIRLLVLGGREQRQQTIRRGITEIMTPFPTFNSKETPLNIMCFLSDLYRFDMISRVKDARAFLSLLQDYVPKRVHEESVVDVIRSSLQFQSIDELEDTMESISILTGIPTDEHINPNKAISPYVVLPESVLGHLLRYISVRWHSMLFEEICSLFEDFQEFMNSSIHVEGIGEKDDNPSPLYCYLRPLCSQSFLDLLGDHSRLQDLIPAMDNLHRYYDSGTISNDLLRLMSFSEYKLLIGPNPTRRHQQAMLSMATVWMRNGNTALAACAVEEALKQAHQRGDHTSVSQALLLLQHILVLGSKLDTTMFLRKSVISSLKQLIKKCTELNLRTFTSQARLLLSQAKMQAPLKGMEPGMAEIGDLCFEITDDVDKFTPQDIWHDILRVQSGESMTTVLSNSGNLYQQIQQQFKGSSTKGPTTTEELGITMPLSICVTSAEFWCRLGIYKSSYRFIQLSYNFH